MAGAGKSSGRTQDPYLGQVLDGRFTLLARIGRGGMGLVYRARQAPLDRNVAVKVLVGSANSERENEFRARFSREAATAAKLKHPNTITVFDYGSEEIQGEQLFWIAMELLEGQTLSRALSKGALDPARAIHVALQMCRSLREAHINSIVHRDLKPGNVMLMRHEDEDGEETEFVKVLDFGLAKTFQGGGQPALTRAGTFLGSPRYVAPEQIEGRPVDPRTDIYSFGCVFYRMLTGTVPFDGESPVEIMMKHLNDEPPDITDPEVPDDLVALCLQCLEKRAKHRPASMQEVITSLKSIRGQLSDRTSWDDVSDVAPLPADAEALSAPAAEMSDPARDSRALADDAVWNDNDDEPEQPEYETEGETEDARRNADESQPAYEAAPEAEATPPSHRSTSGWAGQVPLDDTRPSHTMRKRRAGGGLTALALFALVVAVAVGAVGAGRELGWFDGVSLPPDLAPLLQKNPPAPAPAGSPAGGPGE